AAHYERKTVSRLLELIRKKNDYYTIVEPNSALELLNQAEVLAGLRRSHRRRTPEEQRRGEISALIAAGGDGTVNLVARAALEAGMPMGILPLGRENNIAASLYDSIKPEKCIVKMLEKKQKRIDSATVANQMFFGSIGLGLIPNLAKLLSQNGKPRFGFGWKNVGAKAAAGCSIRNSIIKVDAFRFEISPILLNINLLPYSAGIKLSPVSGTADGLAEVIFDVAIKPKEVGGVLKQMNNGEFYFGEDVRLFRGKNITIQPTAGMMLYLDGELLELPTDIIEVRVGSRPLTVFA
ncbi:MAG: diacylglycerol/lipid kinase family protein, partial [Candidatus Zixiibacteriota bacterium]